MVRTVLRSSVAKWPDSGATTSTRGWAIVDVLFEMQQRAEWRRSAALSLTATSRLPTFTPVMPKGRPGVGQAGARNQLVGRGQVAQTALSAMPASGTPRAAGQRPPRREPAP